MFSSFSGRYTEDRLLSHGNLMQIPAHRIMCCGGNRQIHTDYRVLWRKRDGEATSQEESAWTLALTGFYCFSGNITLRMVLIYYARVHFRWLLFTEKKGDVANYIKKEGYLQM